LRRAARKIKAAGECKPGVAYYSLDDLGFSSLGVAELVAETLELASYDVWYPVHDDEPEPLYDRPDAHRDPAMRLARLILGGDA
jgi:hypothetical protein